MTGIISSVEMSEIDSSARNDFNIPSVVLMENAGLKGWQFIDSEILPGIPAGPFLFAAGGGNNGGDALVMARHAFEKYPERVTVVSVSEKLNSNARIQMSIVKALGIPVLSWPKDRAAVEKAVSEASVVVDGITGTGIKGRLRDAGALFVETVNKCRGVRIAVDVPSGAGDMYKADYPCFKADTTLVFGLPRIAHYLPASRPMCGKIYMINPGFPSVLLSSTGSGDIRRYDFNDFTLPLVDAEAYKNFRGHVCVFAGSAGYSGAAVLSAAAASGTRAGLVSLYVDRDIYSHAASFYPYIMVHPLPDEIGAEHLEKFSSFLCGPGWGGMDRSGTLKTIMESSLPGVVDADGIRILKDLKEKPGFSGGGRIITPHPGELSGFLDIQKDRIMENPFEIVKEAAVKYGLVVVLKMHVVYIASPEGEIAVVDGMNPAMGTGGSGDVLSGIITGFLAQGIAPFDAAVNGVLLHQETGRVCYSTRGWFNAEDLVSRIPSVIKDAGF